MKCSPGWGGNNDRNKEFNNLKIFLDWRIDLRAVVPFDASCTKGLIKIKWFYCVCPLSCAVLILLQPSPGATIPVYDLVPPSLTQSGSRKYPWG